MKLHIILFGLTSLCLLGSMRSPSNRVDWLVDEYNLGIIDETGGEVGGSFSFINKGGEKIYIKDVRPGCGCTGVDFPHGAVNPGDTAVISFTFNPLGRPGKIDKSIKVYLGDSDGAKRLTFTGTVAASEETLRSRYQQKQGDIFIENTHLLGGDLPKGAKRHLFLSVYNNSDDSISPRLLSPGDYLTADIKPDKIGAKESGTITFYLDTSKTVDLGTQNYEVGLMVKENFPDTVKINIGVNIR